MTSAYRVTLSVVGLILIACIISWQGQVFVTAMTNLWLETGVEQRVMFADVRLVWVPITSFLLIAASVCLVVNIFKPLKKRRKGLIRGLTKGLLYGLAAGLIVGAFSGLSHQEPFAGFIMGLNVGLNVGLVFGLVVGLIEGLYGEFRVRRVHMSSRQLPPRF